LKQDESVVKDEEENPPGRKIKNVIRVF